MELGISLTILLPSRLPATKTPSAEPKRPPCLFPSLGSGHCYLSLANSCHSYSSKSTFYVAAVWFFVNIGLVKSLVYLKPLNGSLLQDKYLDKCLNVMTMPVWLGPHYPPQTYLFPYFTLSMLDSNHTEHDCGSPTPMSSLASGPLHVLWSAWHTLPPPSTSWPSKSHPSASNILRKAFQKPCHFPKYE